ncbi:hypothetical protein HY857_02450 [Candidatus Saccharibacteria bacterium]|nr:hypothetical protein [Candidatus Saccharibacteria bacterium]
MKKYYIGLMLLMFGAIGLLVITLSQAKSAKTDKDTLDKAGSISTKLDNYISQKNTIPSDLAAAGIKDVPSTITYTKLSSSKYKLCATFSGASDGYDAGWASLFTGALYGSDSTTGRGSAPGDTQGDYFDSYMLYTHKKGQNCQTVKPYISDSSNCLDYTSLDAYYKCLDNSGSSSQTDTPSISL